MKNSKERFSNRVDNYVRYRPGYPHEVAEVLLDQCSLNEHSIVADIGSGTGIFTRQLLSKNLLVFGIEPNHYMRQAAEEMLSGFDRFTSLEGSAEGTNLAESSVDLVVCAQAFHWFSYSETQKEFNRVLKPGGWVGLVWNQRKMQQGFQQEYEALLREYAPEYNLANHRNSPGELKVEFFAKNTYQTYVFENVQVLDKNGFLGRMQSSSYTPSVGTPEFSRLNSSAEKLFKKYEDRGAISFEYDTQLYLGKLKNNE